MKSKRIVHLEISKHHENSGSKCMIMLAEGEVTLCQKLLVKICTNKFEVPTQIIFGISPHGQNFPLNLSSSKTNNSIGYWAKTDFVTALLGKEKYIGVYTHQNLPNTRNLSRKQKTLILYDSIFVKSIKL